MHASVVVLCALVAVAAGQFYPYAGVVPLNPALGVPLETPEVMHAKAVHAVAWNNAAARSSGWLLRKRREAPAAEAPETPAEESKEKRQIMSFGLGYGLRSPLAYSAWPAYPYTPLTTPYLYRKRRDVSEEPAQEAEGSPKDKRQILAYSTYGLHAPLAYSAWSYPYTLPAAIPATIPASTYLLRKRRDLSEEAAAPEEAEKEKRQIFLSGYGYRSPLAYSAPLAYPYSPYSPFLYRKRRDAEAAPEEHTAEDNKEKRQLILGGYGYGYSPIVRSSVVPSWPRFSYASPYFG